MGKGAGDNCRAAMSLLDAAPAAGSANPKPAKYKLFRVGTAEAPTSEAPETFRECDRHRPDDRPGRAGSLYCSPDLKGSARWYKAALSLNTGAKPHQINYFGPEPYAYPVHAWDIAYARGRNLRDASEVWQEYWASGVPLSQLTADPDFNGEEWEILLDPSGVTGARPVSDQRIVVEAREDLASEIEWSLWPRKMFKGNSLWKKHHQAAKPA